MPKKAMIVGAILVILGGVVSVLSDSNSVTSFIPSFIGAILIVLAVVAQMKPDLSHHMMHGVAAISLLAILGSLGSLIGRGSTGWALFSQLVTIVACGGLMFFAIQSFKAARLAREAAAA
ncbi:MAG: hypothetical protein ACRBK7_05630 [Acidimicrobiales bacterium]